MRKAIPLTILLTGFALLYPMQQWIDRTSPREVISEEALYFSSGDQLKRLSFGHHGLLGGIYWIRTIQYFGGKLVQLENPFATGATQGVPMKLLKPLLRIVVTLDPQNLSAFRFSAIFLAERDPSAAIEMLEYGVRENPQEWRLYQDLGYLHWQAGDYDKAAEWYERGAELPGARWWMRDLVGVMRIKGNSRQTARVVYEGYLESEDAAIRAQAVERLKQLQALDEVDAINAVLASVKQEAGACPASLRALAAKFRALGLTLDKDLLPVDPNGFAYTLDATTCTVKINKDSTLPIS